MPRRGHITRPHSAGVRSTRLILVAGALVARYYMRDGTDDMASDIMVNE